MKRIAIVYAVSLFGFILATDLGFFREAANYVNDHPPLDKAVHFTMYGMLALLLNSALLLSGRPPIRAFAIGSIVVMAVSTIEEYSNFWIVSRSWSLGDLAANYLGILWLGSLPLWCLQRRQVDSREAIDASA